jgi:hypothetical protein
MMTTVTTRPSVPRRARLRAELEPATIFTDLERLEDLASFADTTLDRTPQTPVGPR